MNRTLLVMNGLIVALAVFLVFAISRRTHEFPASQLVWFVPPLSTWLALEHRNRTFGGVAILASGLLAFAGVLVSLMGALGGANSQGTFDLAFTLGGLYLVVVAVLNIKELWAMFPKVRSSPTVEAPK